ncbi:MAG: sensor histidine kinase [Propionibacteriales bacterium]|nr:sensor histidine kinase [Propionibacteriales bacterium]
MSDGQRDVSPALLPGSLVSALQDRAVPDSDPWPPYRRTARDWVVDAAAFCLACGLGGLFLWGENREADGALSQTVLVVDVVLGVIASLGLWLRRRYPVALAIVVALMAVASTFSVIAATITLFTVAVHRRIALVLPVVAVGLTSAGVYAAWRPNQGDPWWGDMLFSAIATAAVVAWGMFVRARRQLVLQLRSRIDQAEHEQRLQTERARLTERARIAREMHDVLAHKVSLITLHAGGLEVQRDLPPEEVRRVAGLIRGTSRQALEELRGIVGVLRDQDGGESAPQAPQPTLTDIPRLVAESRRAGMHITLDMSVDGVDDEPESPGRDSYRIVQEALTNVSKHAPGTAVTVTIEGRRGAGLRVAVRNPMPVGSRLSSSLPGSGMGLVGLSERVTLAGGTLTHGINGDDQFEVVAELRWED